MTAQFEVIIQLATPATLLGAVIFGILEMHRAGKARAEKAGIDGFSIAAQEAPSEGHILVLDLPLATEIHLESETRGA